MPEKSEKMMGMVDMIPVMGGIISTIEGMIFWMEEIRSLIEGTISTIEGMIFWMEEIRSPIEGTISTMGKMIRTMGTFSWSEIIEAGVHFGQKHDPYPCLSPSGERNPEASNFKN